MASPVFGSIRKSRKISFILFPNNKINFCCNDKISACVNTVTPVVNVISTKCISNGSGCTIQLTVSLLDKPWTSVTVNLKTYRPATMFVS